MVCFPFLGNSLSSAFFLGLEMCAKESWKQETLSPSQRSLCNYPHMALAEDEETCVLCKFCPLCCYPVQRDPALNLTSQECRAFQENTSQ